MTMVKVKLQLARMQKGEAVEVLMMGEEPVRNVPRSAAEQGYRVVEHQTLAEGRFRVVIEK
jgi:TusA-related sulfurtransferase